MRLTRHAVVILSLALAACSGSGSSSLSTADNNFVMQAAAGGVGEMTFGQMAMAKSSNPAVQNFAKQMVEDHTGANKELVAIAGRKGVIPPTTLDPGRVNANRQLSNLTGREFDQQYMLQQAQDHELQLALFQQEAQAGLDPELRAFAAKYLPVVQAHAQMAQSVLTGVSEVVPTPAAATAPAMRPRRR